MHNNARANSAVLLATILLLLLAAVLLTAMNRGPLVTEFDRSVAALERRVQLSCDLLAKSHANARKREADRVQHLRDESARLEQHLAALHEQLQPQLDRLRQHPERMANIVMPTMAPFVLQPTADEEAAALKLQASWRRRPRRVVIDGAPQHFCPAWLRRAFVRPALGGIGTPQPTRPPAAPPAALTVAPPLLLPAAPAPAEDGAQKHFMSIL